MTIDTKISFKPLKIGVITISDTRTLETDTSGKILSDYVVDYGHNLEQRLIVKDDIQDIQHAFSDMADSGNIEAIITTGGTGVTGRDVTPEALHGVADKLIPGFGELFRMLSYEKIKTSALQSRATAGIYKGVYIFCLPGSNGAVKDAWNGILQYQLDIRHKPCNFAEMMPRLKEK